MQYMANKKINDCAKIVNVQVKLLFKQRVDCGHSDFSPVTSAHWKHRQRTQLDGNVRITDVIVRHSWQRPRLNNYDNKTTTTTTSSWSSSSSPPSLITLYICIIYSGDKIEHIENKINRSSNAVEGKWLKNISVFNDRIISKC